MRWNTQTRQPKDRDIRCRRPFAWLPTTMTNGIVVWLETYSLVEEYKSYDAPSFNLWRPITKDAK